MALSNLLGTTDRQQQREGMMKPMRSIEDEPEEMRPKDAMESLEPKPMDQTQPTDVANLGEPKPMDMMRPEKEIPKRVEMMPKDAMKPMEELPADEQKRSSLQRLGELLEALGLGQRNDSGDSPIVIPIIIAA